jgi:hypothetical protein
MLTIFAVPKPFSEHINTIQRNAVQSWARLRPQCEIILFGNEPGIEEVAAEFDTKCISDLIRNEYGTPLLHSVFSKAQEIATHSLVCYVNADIILLSDFLEAVQRIRFREFVMAGQRWDVDMTEPWSFQNPDWEKMIRNYVLQHGALHPPLGSDYFVFPKDAALGDIPALAVGRVAWDNWFIYNARKLRIPVVDASKVVTAIHQNHGYSHVRNGTGVAYLGRESDRNQEIIGKKEYIFTLLDATHVMTHRALWPTFGFKYLRRRWQTLPVLRPGTRPAVRMMNWLGGPFRSLYRMVFER